MRPVLLLLVCCAWGGGCLLGGCLGGRSSPSQELMTQVRSFNEALRWQRHPDAASHVPAGERRAFLDERESLEDELRIADYEVSRLDLEAGGARARVQIKFTWHLQSQGTVYTTVVEQRWRRRGDRWQVVGERQVRGEPMPGVAAHHSGGSAGRSARPGRSVRW